MPKQIIESFLYNMKVLRGLKQRKVSPVTADPGKSDLLFRDCTFSADKFFTVFPLFLYQPATVGN